MPDVAVANAGSSSMTILINDGGGGFYEYPESGSSAGYISNLIGIDLQDDGDIDFLGGPDHNEVMTIFNDSYPFTCGDPNNDGQSNVGDVVFIISYVFKGGPAPEYNESGDVNFDGQANVGDAVYLINTIFKNGPPPGCGYNGVYDYYGERDIDTIVVSESIQNGDSVMVTYSFDPDCYFFYPVQYAQSGDSLIFRAYMHYYYYRSFCVQPGGTISVPVSLAVSQPGDYYIVYRNPDQVAVTIPVTIW
jgi:hypothetical protein